MIATVTVDLASYQRESKRIAELEARIAELEMQANKYRRLYHLFGKDDMTDAKFAEAFERVVLADNI
jgi:hypothetical protein